MSTRFIVSAVVGVVAGYFLGPQAGLQAFALTYGVTAGLDPNKKVSGPRLNDLKGPTASEGVPIPIIEGVERIAGTYIWNSDKQEVPHESTQGGKGGPGVDSTTFTYKMDCLILLSGNNLAGIRRVWSTGKLVWSAATDDANSQDASQTTDSWEEIRFYSGALDQLPDPDYEAAVGVGNAPAYRGRSTVFIKGLNLGGSGQLPILNFEVVSQGESGDGLTIENLYDVDSGINQSLVVGINSFVGPQGHVLKIPQWTNTYSTKQVVTMRWNGTGFDDALSFDLPSNFGDTAYNFIPGIADEDFWIARGSANPVTAVDDKTLDSNGVSYGDVSGAISAFAHYEGTTLLLIAANVEISPSDGLRLGSAVVDTAYTPRCATLYQNRWYVMSTVQTLHVYENDDTLTPAGTFTVPATSLSGRAIILTDCVTRDLYYHVDDDLYKWNGDTSTWDAYRIGMGGDLVCNDSATGETMWGGGLYVLQTSSNPGTPATFELNGFRAFYVLVPDLLPLDEVVSRACLRTGQLTTEDIDVTDLASDFVRGIAFNSGTIRQYLELLAAAYQFEATEGATLKFVKRGGNPVATIPYVDLGASLTGDPAEPFPKTRANDIELPSKLSVKFSNALNDFQDGTVYGDRLVTESTAVQSTELPMVLTNDEAQKIVDSQTMDLQVSLVSVGPIAVGAKYAALEPTDVVLIQGQDGSTFRTRVQKVTDQANMRTMELVLDDASTVDSAANGDTTDYSTLLVRAVSDTSSLLIDGPIGRDADNDSGFYLMAKPSDPAKAWSAAVIYSSPDGLTYARETSVTEKAKFGTCTTVLGDWTGPRVFDEANTVTVDIGPGQTLSSSTRDAMLADDTVNAFAIGTNDTGWEYGQFRIATLIGDGVYTLSGLLRGSRGTEWRMVGHDVGERFALLSTAGTRRVQVPASQIGLDRFYKVPTSGKSLASASAIEFTDNAVGLKPFSPVDARKEVNAGTGDITITWQRRTRLHVRIAGPMGESIPLGEEVEAYSIDILDGSNGLVRNLTSSTTEVVYTAAMQSADSYTPGDPFGVAIYQLSTVVGRGYPLEATL